MFGLYSKQPLSYDALDNVRSWLCLLCSSIHIFISFLVRPCHCFSPMAHIFFIFFFFYLFHSSRRRWLACGWRLDPNRNFYVEGRTVCVAYHSYGEYVLRCSFPSYPKAFNLLKWFIGIGFAADISISRNKKKTVHWYYCRVKE